MVPLGRIPAVFLLCASLWAANPGLTIEYPQDGSLFPPDFAPPTFLWHDSTVAESWRIGIAFESGPPISVTTNGPRARLGPIDRDCISTTNKLPEVDPTMRTWKPDPALWATIKRRSRNASATVTFTGLHAGRTTSTASVRIATSPDPVGAPIFYRDVPLMPTETQKGVIKPLAPYAIRLVDWRIRDVGQDESRVVMGGVPVCANCHSFSRDGKTMGMDLDGLQGNRGRYFLANLQPETQVRPADVIQWSTAQGRLESPIRVGFMSQVSPKGDYVVTTIDTPGSGSSNYYVSNFTDYRFLQVFFPTRGLLAWYSPQTRLLTPLPGADDPAFVQFGAVWSPDGEWLTFARAAAQDPNPPGLPPARYANDPNELQIRYDLYRIAFRGGRGGVAEPVAGASANGRSNTFPKISPDGRWLVFVQSRNGQLMRPDSELYIVPATGGIPRRMGCNTPRMNSWHSFSPNGRWMVFSSKARSPYTQMYLTHIDADGNDTPPILIENATPANRAVNLPEFVNIAPGGLRSLGGPAINYYKLYDRALYLEKEKRYGESAATWEALLKISPEDAEAERRLGMVLMLAGRRREAVPHFDRARAAALRKSPLAQAIHELEEGREPPPVTISAAPSAREHYYLALVDLRRAEAASAAAHLSAAVKADPEFAEAHEKLADLMTDPAERLAHLKETIRLRPNHAAALRKAAWILATSPTLHDGAEAQTLAVRALMLTGPSEPGMLDTLAAAYAENGRLEPAIDTARRAIQAEPAHAADIARRLERYRAGQPWRE